MEPYEVAEIKELKVHPDCTVQLDHNYYSAPHEYRGKSVRVKVTSSMVSIFLDLELIATHSRLKGKVGERVLKMEHLPANSRAYLEHSPQSVMSQAKFVHPELHILIEELFCVDTLGNLRRALGLVRKATQLIETHGRDKASPWVSSAIAYMRLFRRYKVQIFEQQLQVAMKTTMKGVEDRNIVRIQGNPMVRGLGGGFTH